MAKAGGFIAGAHDFVADEDDWMTAAGDFVTQADHFLTADDDFESQTGECITEADDCADRTEKRGFFFDVIVRGDGDLRGTAIALGR